MNNLGWKKPDNKKGNLRVGGRSGAGFFRPTPAPPMYDEQPDEQHSPYAKDADLFEKALRR